MKNRIFLCLSALILLGSQGLNLSAQDIGFQVVSGKDVLFGDSTTNEGTRMMWIVGQRALRAGLITSPCSTCWDFNELGRQSVAFGQNTKASGINSFAWGNGTTASGSSSTAWGNNTNASNTFTTAWGENATASGRRSTAWGDNVTASGRLSTAWGIYNIAPSAHETAFGSYSTDYIPESSQTWAPNDRLLVVGNGVDIGNRSDALVILKKGNVGLGESEPVALLHLNTLPTGDTTGMKITNNNFNSLFYHDDNGHLIIRKQNQTNQLVLDQSGNIGLGTTANTHPLELANGAHCTGAGTWTNASDARLKKDIQTTRYGLKEILSLHPVDYKMKATGEIQVGFIAQQIQKIIPEVVSGIEGDMEKGETLGLSYGNLVAVLTKGIQEQQEELEDQRDEIERLNQRISSLERMINLVVQNTDNHSRG